MREQKNEMHLGGTNGMFKVSLFAHHQVNAAQWAQLWCNAMLVESNVGTCVLLNAGCHPVGSCCVFAKVYPDDRHLRPSRPSSAFVSSLITQSSRLPTLPTLLLNPPQWNNNRHNPHNQAQRQKHRTQLKRLTLPCKLFEIFRCPSYQNNTPS